jgi:hypothetical protein
MEAETLAWPTKDQDGITHCTGPKHCSHFAWYLTKGCNEMSGLQLQASQRQEVLTISKVDPDPSACARSSYNVRFEVTAGSVCFALVAPIMSYPVSGFN